jgi:hypothetical protein
MSTATPSVDTDPAEADAELAAASGLRVGALPRPGGCRDDLRLVMRRGMGPGRQAVGDVGLPPGMAILLRPWARRSYAEIRVELGVSEDTVGCWRRGARGALRIDEDRP